MFYENVELHGIEAVKRLEDGSGVALQRYPPQADAPGTPPKGCRADP